MFILVHGSNCCIAFLRLKEILPITFSSLPGQADISDLGNGPGELIKFLNECRPSALVVLP